MKNLVLNGAEWKTRDDFYDALFKILGAPNWHGRNFNALRDSIIGGKLNDVELPFEVYIYGFEKMPNEVKILVQAFCELIQEFRKEGHEVNAVYK